MLYADRVRETTTSTGTGNLTLAGAATGFITCNTAFGVGSTLQFEYVISSVGGSEWEVGVGHLSASTTLVRDTILASSNSGSAVNFSAGTKDVRATLSAHAITATLTPGRLLSVQTFTSGTTYTRPAGVVSIMVEGWAGGGGGGGAGTAAANQASCGAGGGSGGYFKKWYAVAPSSGTYAIGAAGTAGATTPAAGGDGGDTTFTDGTTLCTAKGGKGGPFQATNGAALNIVGGAGGAVSTNGDINLGGFAGGSAESGAGSGAAGRAWSGNGGGPGGGAGIITSGAGTTASGPSGGGGGALALSSAAAAAGGAGGAGKITVWEYS